MRAESSAKASRSRFPRPRVSLASGVSHARVPPGGGGLNVATRILCGDARMADGGSVDHESGAESDVVFSADCESKASAVRFATARSMLVSPAHASRNASSAAEPMGSLRERGGEGKESARAGAAAVSVGGVSETQLCLRRGSGHAQARENLLEAHVGRHEAYSRRARRPGGG